MKFTRRKFILTNVLALIAAKTGFSMIPNEPTTIEYLGSSEGFTKFKALFEILKKMSFAFEDIQVKHITVAAATSSQSKAVIIDSTLVQRAKDAVLLLQSGKHILMNQPIGLSLSDFDTILLQANQKNLRVGTINPVIGMDAFVSARKYLYANKIGKISQIDISISPEYAKKSNGHTGYGSHLLNTACRFIGDSLLEVSAKKNTGANINTTSSTLQFTGKFKHQEINYATNPDEETWRLGLTGEKGKVEILGHNEMIHTNNSGIETSVLKNDQIPEDNRLLMSIYDFLRSLKPEKEPETNIMEGLFTISLNKALVKSQTSGKPVALIEQWDKDENTALIW